MGDMIGGWLPTKMEKAEKEIAWLFMVGSCGLAAVAEQSSKIRGSRLNWVVGSGEMADDSGVEVSHELLHVELRKNKRFRVESYGGWFSTCGLANEQGSPSDLLRNQL